MEQGDNLRKLIVAFSVLILLYGCGSMAKKQVGMDGDKFSPCPSSPNCVSSMSEEPSHFIQPIRYSNRSTSTAKSLLIELLNREKHCKIIEEKERYIHAEFRSNIFHFIDDVEFYFPLNENLIHIKSASRSGYYDFGKNRARIKQITNAFNKKTE